MFNNMLLHLQLYITFSSWYTDFHKIINYNHFNCTKEKRSYIPLNMHSKNMQYILPVSYDNLAQWVVAGYWTRGVWSLTGEGIPLSAIMSMLVLGSTQLPIWWLLCKINHVPPSNAYVYLHSLPFFFTIQCLSRATAFYPLISYQIM